VAAMRTKYTFFILSFIKVSFVLVAVLLGHPPTTDDIEQDCNDGDKQECVNERACTESKEADEPSDNEHYRNDVQ
jgi:hypothetical protein